jgi:hypothetical protein
MVLISIGATPNNVNGLLFLKPKLGKERENDQNKNMKNAVFWGVAPCRCGRLNRRFGGSYRLHLQGRKIRE